MSAIGVIKAVEHCLSPPSVRTSGELEDGAVIISTAFVGCAVQVAGAVGYQTTIRMGAAGAPGKGINCLFLTGGRTADRLWDNP